MTTLQEKKLDLQQLHPTKENLKLLLRQNTLLDKELRAVENTFFAIHGRLKYRIRADYTIQLNDHPEVVALVTKLERINIGNS